MSGITVDETLDLILILTPMSKFPNMKYYGGPDQEETEMEEIPKRACDLCGEEVEEIAMKFYRESGAYICPDCKPRFKEANQ